ncbi:MAG: hypothetical protein RLZZ385_710 [Pseudomonadota bacterium]|jgi:general secretion pathway protein H
MTPISGCKPCGHFIPGSDRGFTLLEILLVMAIIAMASIVVVPNLGGLDARSFAAQVREASALLNYARRIAVVSGQPATASFVIEALAEDEDIRPGLAGRWLSEGSALTYRDSTQREQEVDERVDITFYPEGGSTGGTLILHFEDRMAAIDVDPFTGRITTRLDEDEG